MGRGWRTALAAGAIALGIAASAAADMPAGIEEGYRAYEAGDFAGALAAWRPLAEQGDSRALYNLGLLYDQGKGVTQDRAEAIALWHKAAGAGFAPAQHNLAMLLIGGDGSMRDEKTLAADYGAAAKWLHKAALQGSPASAYTLGKLYAEGLGVRRSTPRAIAWFTKAAEGGDVRAQYNLGKAYRDGSGAPQNMERAARWFREAAERGYPRAQAALAQRYLQGQGVARDEREALFWVSLAADAGLPRAIDGRPAIAARLPAAERQQVEERVRVWKPAHPQ